MTPLVTLIDWIKHMHSLPFPAEQWKSHGIRLTGDKGLFSLLTPVQTHAVEVHIAYDEIEDMVRLIRKEDAFTSHQTVVLALPGDLVGEVHEL